MATAEQDRRIADPFHAFSFVVEFTESPLGGESGSQVPLCSGAFSLEGLSAGSVEGHADGSGAPCGQIFHEYCTPSSTVSLRPLNMYVCPKVRKTSLCRVIGWSMLPRSSNFRSPFASEASTIWPDMGM